MDQHNVLQKKQPASNLLTKEALQKSYQWFEAYLLSHFDIIPSEHTASEYRDKIHRVMYSGVYDESIRDFYKKEINPAGGVNMYAVGDEFCFDFVPADSENEKEKGVWSEFAEEGLGLTDKELSDVDTLLELENEMKVGK